ncbi:MAG: glycosyltransferase [Aestuariivirga sp.]
MKNGKTKNSPQHAISKAPEITQFVLVTPSYNLGNLIEETIYSVAGQAGHFKIRYHVQDGGSTDETLEILKKWKRLLASPSFPKFCDEIIFSYAVGTDSGMYDAINRGFSSALKGQGPCIMSWINADDVFYPGALSAVASFFSQEPAAELCGGRIALTGEDGFLSETYAPQGKDRSEIAHGAYDGRNNGFIQQEGTFWRSELWEKVEGLNPTLRLAGDFDLWRRFSQHAEYHTLDTITAIHRTRAGQLSSDMKRYYVEVDRIMATLQESDEKPPAEGTFFKYQLGQENWKRHTSPARTWRPIRGMGAFEGPYLELGITSGRWMVEKTAEVLVWSDSAGDSVLSLQFRNPRSLAKIALNGQSLKIDTAPIFMKLNLKLPFKAKRGWNPLKLQIGSVTDEEGKRRKLGMFIDDITLKKKKWSDRVLPALRKRKFWF